VAALGMPRRYRQALSFLSRIASMDAYCKESCVGTRCRDPDAGGLQLCK
jgi:hypothetical protein